MARWMSVNNIVKECGAPFHVVERLVGMALCTLCILAFQSCGGGTSGTDGGVTGQYALITQGVVVTSENKPLSEVEVSLAETGDQATTDSEGKFSIGSRLII